MIHLIDEAIKDFLSAKLSLGSDDISFAIPSKEWSNGLSEGTPATLNLYLFDLRENCDLRENRWEETRAAAGAFTRQKPPARIDLFYMITAYSTQTHPNTRMLEEHALLGRVLAVVHNHAFLPEVPFLSDNLTGISPIPEIPIEPVHPKFIETEGGFQLWSALEQSIKPAVFVKVTVPIALESTLQGQAILAKVMKTLDRATQQSETLVQLGGFITDGAADPAAVSDATVSLLDAEGKTLQQILTDSEGKFLFKSVPDGSCTIRVNAAGFPEKSLLMGLISEADTTRLVIGLT